MNIFELVIDEEAEVFGVEAISLVEKPAIEADFVALKKEEPNVMLADQEQRIVMGPALIPDKPIYRRNGDAEFYVYFSKTTIRRAMELYFQQHNQANTTLEHEDSVNQTYLMESWIVEDPEMDKSKLYGMSVPRGTWMVTMKIENDEVWKEYVKTEKVKGFSIEGFFVNRLNLSEDPPEVNMESYADYGDGVKNNAKRGIELNDRQGNKCATQTGKVRAQQLASGEAISVETIRRMYSYLSRAEEYYDPNKTTECGTISYLLWGGKAALGWSRNKLAELDVLEEIEELCKEMTVTAVNESNPPME